MHIVRSQFEDKFKIYKVLDQKIREQEEVIVASQTTILAKKKSGSAKTYQDVEEDMISFFMAVANAEIIRKQAEDTLKLVVEYYTLAGLMEVDLDLKDQVKEEIQAYISGYKSTYIVDVVGQQIIPSDPEGHASLIELIKGTLTEGKLQSEFENSAAFNRQ